MWSVNQADLTRTCQRCGVRVTEEALAHILGDSLDSFHRRAYCVAARLPIGAQLVSSVGNTATYLGQRPSDGAIRLSLGQSGEVGEIIHLTDFSEWMAANAPTAPRVEVRTVDVERAFDAERSLLFALSEGLLRRNDEQTLAEIRSAASVTVGSLVATTIALTASASTTTGSVVVGGGVGLSMHPRSDFYFGEAGALPSTQISVSPRLIGPEIYHAETAPASARVGALWIDAEGRAHIWDGTTWVPAITAASAKVPRPEPPDLLDARRKFDLDA